MLGEVSQYLEERGYKVSETSADSEELWITLDSLQLVESGPHSTRLWKPNEFLGSVLDHS